MAAYEAQRVVHGMGRLRHPEGIVKGSAPDQTPGTVPLVERTPQSVRVTLAVTCAHSRCELTPGNTRTGVVPKPKGLRTTVHARS